VLTGQVFITCYSTLKKVDSNDGKGTTAILSIECYFLILVRHNYFLKSKSINKN
jgi:hypothetical protein